MTTKRKPVNEETLGGALVVQEGRRHINLNQGEREALARQRQIESAVALFLDLTTDHTWAEIAAELNISVSALKRLTQAPDFMSIYEEALATIGHDPRLLAVTSSLGDLLPAARRRLGTLITDTNTPDGVALKAIERLFQWTGADSKIEVDNPDMLKNFLSQHNVQVQGDLNIVNIPPEYQAAFERFLGGDRDIVAGEAHTVDSTSAAVSEKAPVEQSRPDEPSAEEA